MWICIESVLFYSILSVLAKQSSLIIIKVAFDIDSSLPVVIRTELSGKGHIEYKSSFIIIKVAFDIDSSLPVVIRTELPGKGHIEYKSLDLPLEHEYGLQQIIGITSINCLRYVIAKTFITCGPNLSFVLFWVFEIENSVMICSMKRT